MPDAKYNIVILNNMGQAKLGNAQYTNVKCLLWKIQRRVALDDGLQVNLISIDIVELLMTRRHT